MVFFGIWGQFEGWKGLVVIHNNIRTVVIVKKPWSRGIENIKKRSRTLKFFWLIIRIRRIKEKINIKYKTVTNKLFIRIWSLNKRNKILLQCTWYDIILIKDKRTTILIKNCLLGNNSLK